MATALAMKPVEKKHGLGYWMESVLEECDRAAVDFSADPVHDLRVALRRCRSMADGLMAIDPDPSWKRMKKAGRQLFRQLGELRDTQVMEDWIHKLATPGDPAASALLRFLATQESAQKQKAAQAFAEFDGKQWKKWAASLPRRESKIPAGSLLYKHLALERWTEAYRLHRRAIRTRSSVPWHSLRIGIKRFRYIVENFLPEHHQAWIDDLKQLQDALGEIHDFDVLWATAVEIQAFPDEASRSHWRDRLEQERNRRMEQYRQRMVGKDSLWQAWRAELPRGKEIEAAAFARLKFWASVLDPDFRHSLHVARFALQLHEGFSTQPHPSREFLQERKVLELSALLHDVGIAKRQKDHHKATARLLQELNPPLGVKKETLRLVASVGRYHRGALPHRGQKTFDQIPSSERRMAMKLAAILRLANAFDSEHNRQIDRIEIEKRNGFFLISARGYNSRSKTAETIAAARHLLEVVMRKPILVRALPGPRIHRKPGS